MRGGLADLSQIADVADLPPTFRMRAGGSLMEAEIHCTPRMLTMNWRFAPTASRHRSSFSRLRREASERGAFGLISRPNRMRSRSYSSSGLGRMKAVSASSPKAMPHCPSGPKGSPNSPIRGICSSPIISLTPRYGARPLLLCQGDVGHGLAKRLNHLQQ